MESSRAWNALRAQTWNALRAQTWNAIRDCLCIQTNTNMMQARTTRTRTSRPPAPPHPANRGLPKCGGEGRPPANPAGPPPAARARAAERRRKRREAGQRGERRRKRRTPKRGGGGPPNTPHGWGGAQPYANTAAKRHPLRGVPACGTPRRPRGANAHDRRVDVWCKAKRRTLMPRPDLQTRF